MSKLQPHQQRVVREKAFLDKNIVRLSEFIKLPLFKTVSADEQVRLQDQLVIMATLTEVLKERIEAFELGDPAIPVDDITSQELKAAGKDGPRITREEIEALLAKVTYVVTVPEGTTTTFAHAYLGTFYLGSGFSACVDPANFVAAIGERIARADAEANATKELWKLEGYALYRELNHG